MLAHQQKPYRYYLYIDDIFIIRADGEENTKQFYSLINTFYPSIRIKKIDYSNTHMSISQTLQCTSGMTCCTCQYTGNSLTHATISTVPPFNPSTLNGPSCIARPSEYTQTQKTEINISEY